MKVSRHFFSRATAVMLLSLVTASAAWQPGKAPLMTRWAKDVSPQNALPEYPRPQLVRAQWQNLNGLWSYAITPREVAKPEKWDGEILVPFPVESALSGVMRAVTEKDRLWYRRTFTVPREWKGQRVVLHFGAVDWETTVYVNGKELGTHRGGYDGFSFDITDALKSSGENEILVAVWDPTHLGQQPIGKQNRQPHGIWYTPTSGIWQTVWLEPVSAAHIAGLKLTPDVDAGTILVATTTKRPSGNSAAQATEARVEVFDGRTRVAEMTVPVLLMDNDTTALSEALITVPKAKLWSPDTPFLYDLKVTLFNGRTKIDEVSSYFGMRKISLGQDAQGITRLFLNNKPVFQFGPLDQGFWPDGLYTAPTDEALRFDIVVTKQLGFNMARKHVKVEPARWYYWCDKLGLLVWQDMPSGDRHIRSDQPDIVRTPESAKQYEVELREMIAELYNYPSIVMWVPFNEGWGQFDTARIAKLVEELDPTRLVNSVSGWADRGVGHVHDWHVYPGPGVPPLEKARAAVLGEFGGLGLPIRGHLWQGDRNWGYETYQTKEALTDAYVAMIKRTWLLTGEKGLSAAVYTQTTDVEGEVNGLLTYDRAMMKMDVEKIAAVNRLLYGAPPKVTTLVPAADVSGGQWRYTTNRPGEYWNKPGFGDSKWAVGYGGFGSDGTPGARIGTLWTTPEIWLRREVELTAEQLPYLELWLHHDEDAVVYLNGVEAVRLRGYTTGYGTFAISEAAKAALKPGKNLIAVHCRQTSGGQFIDVGLIALEPVQ